MRKLILSLVVLAGCDSSGVGVPATRDAGPAGADTRGADLVQVALAMDAGPDLVVAQDLGQAPDTSPAQLPDAWQAPGVDSGSTMPDAVVCPSGSFVVHFDNGMDFCQPYQDGGASSDALAPSDTFCSTVGYSVYCQPDAGKQNCQYQDPTYCADVSAEFLFGPMGLCTTGAYGGSDLMYPYRDECPGRCGLCTITW